MCPLFLLLFAQMPMADDIYIAARGPYRFAVDTGAESSIVDARLAAKLNLRPRYRVEMVTPAGTQLTPAVQEAMQVGRRDLRAAEALVLPLENWDGVLGQSALRQLDYTIDTERGRVFFGEMPSGEGKSWEVPLRYLGTRIAVEVEAGEETLSFVLDSGAGAILLVKRIGGFRTTGMATMQTHSGRREVEYGEIERLRLGGKHWKRVAAGLAGAGVIEADGLMPTRLFRRITVMNSKGTLRLEF